MVKQMNSYVGRHVQLHYTEHRGLALLLLRRYSVISSIRLCLSMPVRGRELTTRTLHLVGDADRGAKCREPVLARDRRLGA